ncbi:hypothetical protein FKK32_29585, partial [Klebsiella pneumoniae]|nr:hypothetical protein [Klebsiella pneumoniae]
MDDLTIAALHRFQDDHGLERGDVVDDETWRLLGRDTEHPVGDDDESLTVVGEKSQSDALMTLKQRNAQMLSQASGELAPAARRFLR